MARIRSIKPDFWTDEKVVELDYADRLLFIGMWNFADDQGYLDYSLKRIKMQVFPGDDIEVSRGLQRLHSLGLIRLYDSPEGLILHITNWEKHQRVSNPSRARFSGDELQECDWPGEGVQSPREPSRLLGKGREGKGSSISSGKPDDVEGFSEFYDAYPKKQARRNAEKAWRAALKRADRETIMAGLKRYEFRDDAQFVPLPATWLNQDRWADEKPAPLHTVVGERCWSATELDAVLGPDTWRCPQPPRGLSGDDMWDWEQRIKREHRADRVAQAEAKLGGAA